MSFYKSLIWYNVYSTNCDSADFQITNLWVDLGQCLSIFGIIFVYLVNDPEISDYKPCQK